MGKPTIFNQDLADEICRRIIGGETLKAICDEAGMPHNATVQNWRHKNLAFNDQYASAREMQAETIFDEILEIADNTEIGTRTVISDDETKTYEGDMVEHRKLRIQARQWMLPRLSKKMTDKAQLDHTSSDGSMSPMSDEAKDARLTAIHQAAKKRVAASRKSDEGFVGDDGSDLA